MAFFDDWGWLGDLGSDIVGGVGDFFGGGVDAFDLADTSDYWSSDLGFSDDFNWGGLLTGAAANIPWGDLAKAGYAGYRSGQAGQDYMDRYAPIQGLFSTYLPQIQAALDPATARKGIRQETEYRKGLVDPIWREAEQKRQARALRAGMADSTPFMGQEQDWTEREAQYLQQKIMPAAEQAYYQMPTRMSNQLTQLTGLMSGQPIMQPTYQAAQASPWQYALDKYMYGL